MNPTPRSPRGRSALRWLAAAPLLWLVAAAVDRRTEVVIDNLGDHLSFAVAGTELVLPDPIRSVNRVTVHAAPSVDRPGGGELVLRHDGGVEGLRLPARFPADPASPRPVGDWWVDGQVDVKVAGDRRVAVDGPFELRTVLHGRFSNDLTITLEGRPTVFFSLRRGLLDNYLVMRAADGALLAVTTLDPTPAADALAIAAQLLRAAAAGCLLVAFVLSVAAVFPGSDRSATPPRAAGSRRKPPSRSALIAVLGLAGIAVAVSSWVAVDVLGGLPHQIDEVVYLLQARWLLDGEIAPAAEALHDHLAVPFTYLRDGRWLGHYPVGWPSVLVAGLAVGRPDLVNAVLGAVFVVLVFLLGREIDDEWTGLAAAVLTAVSPLARLMGATMFPHTTCAVLVALALWLVLLSRRLSGWWPGAAIGCAMGGCLAVRPMTAVVVSLVLGGWLAVEALSGRRPRATWTTLAAATVAGLVAAVPTLIHNASVTGSPLRLPYSLASGTMYGPGNVAFGLRNLDAILVSTSANLEGWGWPLLTGGLVLALPLAFVGLPFLIRRARPEDRLLLALLVAAAAGHLPTRANGLHGFGPRYAFDVGVCLYLLAGRGFRELARAASPAPVAARAVLALFLALNLAAAAALPRRLGLYRGYDDVTGDLERQLAATGLRRALILVDPGPWQAWGEGARLITGPRRHDIVIAADLRDNSVLETAYPDRPLLRWDGDRLIPEGRGAH